MQVGASTNDNIYSQYQSLIDGLKSGSISYEDALKENMDLAVETRGHSAFVGISGKDLTRVDPPPGLIERIQQVLALARRTSSEDATQAYQQVQNSGAGEPTSNASEIALRNSIGWQLLKDVRYQLNDTAHDYLSDYANAHRAEWTSATAELGITRGGLEQFYSVPYSSQDDIGLDAPASNAERIFRHIAGAEDVAKFDNLMAPKKQELDGVLKAKVLGMLEQTNDRMKQFEPYMSIFEAAGITSDDLARTLVTRTKSGEYSVIGGNGKADVIQSLITSNTDLRAFYDQQYKKWDGFV